MAIFKGAYPISDENLMALPVKEIAPAVAFYQSVMGFSVVSQDDETAELRRDDARIGLVRKADHQPGEAGSFAVAVDDLAAVHRELKAKPEIEVGEFRNDTWNGKNFRVFFVREKDNGYCYCFHMPA